MSMVNGIKDKLKTAHLARKGIYFRPRTFRESTHAFEQSSPLLLIGLPRSGTSITLSILNQFSDVYMTYEAISEPYIFEKDKYRLTSLYYENIRQALHIFNSSSKKGKAFKQPLYSKSYKYLGNKSIFAQTKKYQRALEKCILSNKKLKVIFLERNSSDRTKSVEKWNSKRDVIFTRTKKAHVSIETLTEKENDKSIVFEKYVKRFEGKNNVLSLSYEELVAGDGILQKLSSFLDIEKSESVDDFYTNNIFTGSANSS